MTGYYSDRTQIKRNNINVRMEKKTLLYKYGTEESSEDDCFDLIDDFLIKMTSY